MKLAELENDISTDWLHKEGYDKVRKVVLTHGEDWSGNESLFIWLLVDNKVKDRDLSWKKIEPMVEKVRRRASERMNFEFFPYIRVLRENEYGLPFRP